MTPQTIQTFTHPDLYAHNYGRVDNDFFGSNLAIREFYNSFVKSLSYKDDIVIISDADYWSENLGQIYMRERLRDSLHGLVPFHTDRLGTTYGVDDEGAVAVTRNGFVFLLDEWLVGTVYETRRYAFGEEAYFKIKSVSHCKGLSLKSLK